ncbi:class I SAM-dependent methyltransferase [Candidatus Avelusimicrobium aviculae]|uniref:class I SAM-dependent methyltransferase n=1 Tax=Candidatus Avelusimicrobium aviculae TaxID=3416206 RepID=UPI003D11D8F0
MKGGTTTDWREKELAQWYNQNMRGSLEGYAALFGFEKADHVLDLGCGDGTLLAIAAQQGARVTGVDISDEQLHAARAALKGVKGASLIKQTLQEVNFPDNSFTKVSIRKAIHHLTNDEKGLLIDKIYHWLKPGGILIIEDMILTFALHRRDENRPLVEKDAAIYYGVNWPDFRDAFYTTMYQELPCDLAQLSHHLLFTGFHILKIASPACFMSTVIAEK